MVRGRRVAAVLSVMISAIACGALAGAGGAQEVASTEGRAKNVIIFIGDGMGTSHRDLIRYATVGTEGQLAMDSMPVAGRSETSPLDPEAFEAVEVGQSFAQKDPGTLVIVAADHETGSLAIEDTNEIQSDPAYPNESGAGRTKEDGPFRVADSDKEFLVDWTTTNHTAEDVPVTAMGPGSENLVGVYENTHIHDAMLTALFGTASAASASSSASASASASGSAGVHGMPETGGLALETPLLALATVLLGITGIAYVRKVVRGP
jgi:alkaline phosphatase